MATLQTSVVHPCLIGMACLLSNLLEQRHYTQVINLCSINLNRVKLLSFVDSPVDVLQLPGYLLLLQKVMHSNLWKDWYNTR